MFFTDALNEVAHGDTFYELEPFSHCSYVSQHDVKTTGPYGGFMNKKTLTTHVHDYNFYANA